jgi:hypothetical protein
MMQFPLPASRYVVRISGLGSYNLEVRNNPGLFKVRRIAWCDSLLRVLRRAKARDARSADRDMCRSGTTVAPSLRFSSTDVDEFAVSEGISCSACRTFHSVLPKPLRQSQCRLILSFF